mmetsp:Transcript_11706/g.37266  ORF Transcript_11706/g.37266 Transcript_11706/m.37266 type:complete len:316 (+) Transcript_11706:2553-3500(+)
MREVSRRALVHVVVDVNVEGRLVVVSIGLHGLGRVPEFLEGATEGGVGGPDLGAAEVSERRPLEGVAVAERGHRGSVPGLVAEVDLVVAVDAGHVPDRLVAGLRRDVVGERGLVADRVGPHGPDDVQRVVHRIEELRVGVADRARRRLGRVPGEGVPDPAQVVHGEAPGRASEEADVLAVDVVPRREALERRGRVPRVLRRELLPADVGRERRQRRPRDQRQRAARLVDVHELRRRRPLATRRPVFAVIVRNAVQPVVHRGVRHAARHHQLAHLAAPALGTAYRRAPQKAASVPIRHHGMRPVARRQPQIVRVAL